MEIPEALRKEVAKASQEARITDEAGAQAALTPFPGPLKASYAIQQDIPVLDGKLSVRPLKDADFEFLDLIDHPLGKVRKEAWAGRNVSEFAYEGRGPEAWNICFILTTPIREVDKLIRDGGAKALTESAREKFIEYTVADILQIGVAVMQQYERAFSTLVAHGPADVTGKAGDGKASDPCQSEPPLTAMGGS